MILVLVHLDEEYRPWWSESYLSEVIRHLQSVCYDRVIMLRGPLNTPTPAIVKLATDVLCWYPDPPADTPEDQLVPTPNAIVGHSYLAPDLRLAIISPEPVRVGGGFADLCLDAFLILLDEVGISYEVLPHLVYD